MTWSSCRVWPERRVEFSHAKGEWVAVQINTGRVEVYRVEVLEMFQGYADDRTLPASLVVAALGALAKAGQAARVPSQVLAVSK